MSSSEVVQLKNIHKQYQMGESLVNALKNIQLTIHTSEYIAILGPSGSGKSTLMNVLGCLDTPTSGEYYLSGRDVSKLTSDQLAEIRNRQIGFVFQNFNLLAYASALDNVALPLVYRGLPTKLRRQQAEAMLQRVGLGERIHHLPNELSGGQRQRVAIARALVTSPDIILADEPTGNLDSQSGQAVLTLFAELANAGKTIIIVTHDLKIAKLAKRVLTIQDGKIIADELNLQEVA